MSSTVIDPSRPVEREHSKSSTARPRAALFGLAFFVLAIAGTIAYPGDPEFAAEPAALAAHYADNQDGIMAADSLYLLSAAALLAFLGYLWTASRRAEGDGGRLAGTALAGGVAGAALMLGAAALDTMGALRVAERDTIDPQVATVLADGSAILFGLAAPFAMAVLVLATAALALRHGLLPSWHGAVSVVVGVALLIPMINYLVIEIGFTFWILLTSLMLFVRPEPRTADQRSRRENARVATAPVATR